MTNELTIGVYSSAWVGITGTLILMVNWVGEKLTIMFGEFVARVNRKNADLGLDQSVDVEDLARDYLFPFRSGSIEHYLEQNDFSEDRYLSELDADVGQPIAFILFSLLFGITLFLAFSGPAVYYLTGFSLAAEYLLALYAMTAINLLAYFLL